MRDGLLTAFGVDLEADCALSMLLRNTVESNAAITSPGSRFGEASLLVRRLEGSGVLDRMGDIAELNKRSREAHLDIVEELIGLLGPGREVVTSADLKAIGLDDTPPNNADHEMDY